MAESVKCSIQIGSQKYQAAQLGNTPVELYYHEATKKLYIVEKKITSPTSTPTSSPTHQKTNVLIYFNIGYASPTGLLEFTKDSEANTEYEEMESSWSDDELVGRWIAINGDIDGTCVFRYTDGYGKKITNAKVTQGNSTVSFTMTTFSIKFGTTSSAISVTIE